MITVKGLTKYYGGLRALHDVSFSVGKNEVVGLLGPNGAGKSTALRIISGFVGPSSGSVRIADHDLGRSPLQARAALGYMPETAPLYPEMRVAEYLAFRAALKRVPRREREPAVARAMNLTQSSDVRGRLIGQLSKGLRQRVALADALVSNPPLLILDEPTSSLDPNQIRETRELIRDLGKDHAVLVSTHILSEVEAVCDRAIVIHRGEVAAQGSVAELRALRTANRAEVRLREDAGKAVVELLQVTGVRGAAPRGPGRVELEFADGSAPEEVLERAVARLVEKGFKVRHAALAQASLDEVFALLTRDEPDAEREKPDARGPS
jgi:ABC-2 type transport system ATP-binding protein